MALNHYKKKNANTYKKKNANNTRLDFYSPRLIWLLPLPNTYYGNKRDQYRAPSQEAS